MLDEAGLVRTEKNRGVFVRDIPLDEAIEIFELRATMDELVGRRLAERDDARNSRRSRPWSMRWRDAVKAADSHTYHLLNLQFHDRLVEMAGNRKLATIYRKLVKEISLFRRLNLAGAQRVAGLGPRALGHPRGHQVRRRRHRRPRLVRACDEQPHTHHRKRRAAPQRRARVQPTLRRVPSPC